MIFLYSVPFKTCFPKGWGGMPAAELFFDHSDRCLRAQCEKLPLELASAALKMAKARQDHRILMPSQVEKLARSAVILHNCKAGGKPAFEQLGRAVKERAGHSCFCGGNFAAQWNRALDSTRDHVACVVLQVLCLGHDYSAVAVLAVCSRAIHASPVVVWAARVVLEALGADMGEQCHQQQHLGFPQWPPNCPTCQPYGDQDLPPMAVLASQELRHFAALAGQVPVSYWCGRSGRYLLALLAGHYPVPVRGAWRFVVEIASRPQVAHSALKEWRSQLATRTRAYGLLKLEKNWQCGVMRRLSIMRDYLPDIARGTQDPKADSLDATPKFVEHDTSRSRLHKGNLSAGWHRERVLDHGRRIGELSLQECIRAFQQWATDNYQQIAPVLPAFANGYLSQKVAKELANWSLAPDVPPNPHQDCGNFVGSVVVHALVLGHGMADSSRGKPALPTPFGALFSEETQSWLLRPQSGPPTSGKGAANYRTNILEAMELHMHRADCGLVGVALLARLQELVLRLCYVCWENKSLQWEDSDLQAAELMLLYRLLPQK